MSVLIGTPAYGGMLTVPWYQSVDEIRNELYGVDVLVTAGESHVTRARNNIVATFLTKTDYKTLFFLDADIAISASDFRRIAILDGVRGAAVACKTPDQSEALSIWANGERPIRAQMPPEPFPVDFLGSAVLAIDRDVFERLRESENVQEYTDPIVGQAWDFFRDGVAGDVWLSEDYGFCELCRACDVPIVCDPAVIVNHYGTAAWRH